MQEYNSWSLHLLEAHSAGALFLHSAEFLVLGRVLDQWMLYLLQLLYNE